MRCELKQLACEAGARQAGARQETPLLRETPEKAYHAFCSVAVFPRDSEGISSRHVRVIRVVANITDVGRASALFQLNLRLDNNCGTAVSAAFGRRDACTTNIATLILSCDNALG